MSIFKDKVLLITGGTGSFGTFGDVRDKRSVDGTMTRVDYVFHAAALKQVPSGVFAAGNPCKVVKQI